jgi:hypothetical protein
MPLFACVTVTVEPARVAVTGQFVCALIASRTAAPMTADVSPRKMFT